MLNPLIYQTARKDSPVDDAQKKSGPFITGTTAQKIVPEILPEDPNDQKNFDAWGFHDTSFRVNPRGHAELTGQRYELCGSELPNLLPWIRRTVGIDVASQDFRASNYPPSIPAPSCDLKFLDEVHNLLGKSDVSQDPEVRLRHGHGHTQEEIYAIRYGRLPRVPDIVLYPRTEDQVSRIVEMALRHDVCLIPYGGGTNVTEALRCPEGEERTIASVDLRHLNRILWIDPVNYTACIQAGAVGRHIARQLARYGFALGHEPDSVEFSTLGGWIATHASGMKKNKYGNIEDIVLDLTAVTSRGVLTRSSASPRESVGCDPRKWLLGSEGSLGIITSAVVKLSPLPEVQCYGSILFPNFERGVAFMYELACRRVLPASVRLVDNLQFHFSQALKPETASRRSWRSRLERFYVTSLRGFDPQQLVACTLVFEGTRREVAAQEAFVYRIARRFGGMKAGAENGRKGYQLTFGIAYIRDFIMNHYILAESFETSVPWSQVLSLCENVKRRVAREHAKRKLSGKPVITCRVTQIYPTGACVYFYFAYYYKDVDNPSEVYSEIEHAARNEILRSGGSLSHHHGIGKLRSDFLPQIMSPEALEWKRRLKEAVDPHNVFGCHNQIAPTASHAAIESQRRTA